MKKFKILIASLLALSAVCAAGCNGTETAKTDIEQKNYDTVQEKSDNGCEEDNDCEENDCKDGNKPEFKFVQPEKRRLPPHMPHRRHGHEMPPPAPELPESN